MKAAPIRLLLCFLLGAALQGACGEDIPMGWRESGFSLSFYHDPSTQEVLFKKEPDYQGERVLRGALPYGAKPGQPVAYALDWARKALFLDLNRNLDLADDVPIIADNKDGSTRGFTRVFLEGPAGEGPRYVVNLTFYTYTDRVRIEVQSGWTGELTVGSWAGRVAFVDDLNGQWSQRDQLLLKPADVEPGGATDLWAVPLAPCLFLGGRQNQVALEPGDTRDAAWRLKLEEKPAASGMIHLRGDRIERLLLEGKSGEDTQVVVLDRPGEGPLEIPTGTYTKQTVMLRAATNWLTATRYAPVAVQYGRTADLAIGAPLNGTAEARRYGARLYLTQAVKGRGGETYTLPSSRGGPPKVEIWKGDRHLASGQFEYG